MELTMVMKCCLLLIVSCALLTTPVAARPPPHRQKRVSDQRLAELETLLALAKIKNRKYVTLPVGYGLIDVHKIGRRKRASPLGVAHPPLVQDPNSTDYDLSNIIADLSSNLSPVNADRNNKDEPFLEGNYTGDLEDGEGAGMAAEGSLNQKVDYPPGGLRSPFRSLFWAMRARRQQQQPFADFI